MVEQQVWEAEDEELGEKVYPKMKKSKRMVNQYNRPGCAGAKHGLGLKHNLIWNVYSVVNGG